MKSMAHPEQGGAALRYPAAALAFASELIHLWVLPGQFVAAMLPGIFFLLVAACQGLLAVSLLFGPRRWTLRFGILLNLFVNFGLAFFWPFDLATLLQTCSRCARHSHALVVAGRLEAFGVECGAGGTRASPWIAPGTQREPGGGRFVC